MSTYENSMESVLKLRINAPPMENVSADTPKTENEVGGMSVSSLGDIHNMYDNESFDGSVISPLEDRPSVCEIHTVMGRANDFRAPRDLPMPKQRAPIYTFVLTGGPCGGKTTALSHISSFLERHGYAVFCVPEIPTIMITGGCKYPGLTGQMDELIQFEVALVRMQQAVEESFMRVAASVSKPAVLLLDRGMADPAAYLPRHLWIDILDAAGLSEKEIMARYDMVLHLETVAKNAVEYYTTSNNAARSESVEDACKLDDKVLGCWTSHPQHRVFDNSTDFKGKLDRILNAVGEVLGVVPSK